MPPLRFAIDVSPLGELSDPRTIVRLARSAEASGWHGLSTWDSLGLSMGTSSADPFVSLAGVAVATQRLRLITSIVALARRRPQLVVQSAASLDLLSDGRLILGLGAGEDPPDFEPFGESHAPSARVARMDEALAIVDGLLRGETVDHAGPLLEARGIALGPRPVQQPRPPIWFGGMKPGALRRAASWDGWIAVGASMDGKTMEVTPQRLAEMVAVVHEARRATGTERAPFDVAVLGVSGPELPYSTADFAVAGATWWFESLSTKRGSADELEAIVRRGPPT